MKIILSLLIVCTVFCAVHSASCNDPNATYSSCGTACERTCSTQSGTFCIEVCVPGCFCNSNYVLGPNGNCILPASC